MCDSKGGFSMKRIAFVLSFVVSFTISPLLAQQDLLTEIRNVEPYVVKSDGFVLESKQDVSIQAVAASDRYRGIGTAVWILDKASRDVVWKLHHAPRHGRNHGLADYDDVVQLPKGEYEVYYAAYPEPTNGIESFGEFMDFLAGKIFDGSRHGREYRDLSLTIRGRGQHVSREGIDQWLQGLKKDALVSLSGLWDNDYAQQGFVLEKPAEVTVYAIGEIQDESLDDYGWIINVKTGKRVWEMTDANTEHAGGASKNRFVRQTVSLPAGQYVAFFTTDGSHSYRDWNAPPPYDPSFWGITIWVKDEGLKKYAKLYDYKAAEEKNAGRTTRDVLMWPRPELLDEARHPGLAALAQNRADPCHVAGPSPGTALAAADHPMDPAARPVRRGHLHARLKAQVDLLQHRLDADEAHRRGRLSQERDAFVGRLLVLARDPEPDVR